ncbi:MAG: peptidylprolyl isomerase [Desulfobacterota bacterium]|nr:peptidylprolyl isomerase [Thermodesulfobacteriota bacterium]
MALGFPILFLLGAFLPTGQAVVDRIVAVVNQEIITLSEVERMIVHLKPEAEGGDRLEKRQRNHELARMALERLIEERLIDQEARRLGVKVNPKEIEQAIEEIKRKNNATQEDLELTLARDGWTMEGFKKEVEKKLVRTKVVQWAVKVEPNVPEKELKEFYRKHLDRYGTEASYRPAHILFKVPKEATPSEIREIRSKCEKVLARVKAGEDFGEMALLYSEDLSAKDRGDLGVFKQGELLPALEREALRLKVGEVSGIVRTEYGFHILKLLDRKEAAPLPFEEVREKVRQDYLEKEFERGLQQFLARLKEKATIDIKL